MKYLGIIKHDYIVGVIGKLVDETFEFNLKSIHDYEEIKRQWKDKNQTDLNIPFEDVPYIEPGRSMYPYLISLTLFQTFAVNDYELEALIDWHHDQKCYYANKEEYGYADEHKKRAIEIQTYLKTKHENISSV